MGRSVAGSQLKDFVPENLIDPGHIGCTNRWAPPTIPKSAWTIRVLGVDGLRLADASIFPWVASAVLVHDKIADLIRTEG